MAGVAISFPAYFCPNFLEDTMEKWVSSPKVRTMTLRVWTAPHAQKELLEEIRWKNMPLNLVIKYSWYFQYRAALWRVQYPKAYHEYTWFQHDPKDQVKVNLEERKRKNRITTCKRMVTKFTNAIEKYEAEQNATLLPNLENPDYLKVIEKRDRYQEELDKLLNDNYGSNYSRNT